MGAHDGRAAHERFSVRRFSHLVLTFARERRGGVMITVAIALPALLGASGLAVDLGQWYRERTTLQFAADAAALGAARLLRDAAATPSDYRNVALAEAKGAIGTGTVGHLSTPPVLSIVPMKSVTVTLTAIADRYFTAALLIPSPTLSASAEAGIMPPPDCVLALDGGGGSGIAMTGNAQIVAPECGIFSDAPGEDSILLTGNITIHARSIGSVGITQVPANGDVTPAPVDGASSVPDPLTSLPPPTPGPCMSGTSSYTGNQTVTLEPGTYCSGLSFTGNTTLTLTPGVYIFERDFTLDGNVTIASASGVMFYFVGGPSAATLEWTGNITTQSPMTAPSEGPYAGVLVYQDRSASLGTPAAITGNATFSMGGTLYMPRADLTLTGNSAASPPAAQGFSVIANTIAITGNTSFAAGTQPNVTWTDVALLQ